MLDAGYKSCSSPTTMQTMLANYAQVANYQTSIPPKEIALVLGMMARTHVSLEAATDADGALAKTWHPQIFASALLEKVR
jgi:hypothetical protein